MSQVLEFRQATFLDQNCLPLRDYHKAKRLAWDPQMIDWSVDQVQWPQLEQRERDLVIQGISLFLGGEEAVTHDLAPLLIALKRSGGSIEEEMFLTSQLFDEARHVELFDAVSRNIFGHPVSAGTWAGDSYRALFGELNSALEALLDDQSLAAQVHAVASYHMIIEGVLAETGYYGIFTALRKRGLLPGLQQGLEYIQRDEARHVAFGLHLLSRAIRSDARYWEQANERMDALLPHAMGVFIELVDPFLPDIPFELDLNNILDYASSQFSARVNVLQRALG